MMKKVLVIGEFNVLHPGHVRLLRFASECGDHLIVAVQSDKVSPQSIHVNEQLRLESVASNSYVDESFVTNETPEELVRRLRPDILVKGREHENRSNPEELILSEYGGELLFDSGEVSFSSIDLLEKEFSFSEKYDFKLPHNYMERHQIKSEQLLGYIDKFSNLNIAVIGDLIMDEYVICDPLGMSQEDPTIVVAPIDKELFIGGAGIVAAHAGGLGANVKFISVTGSDLMYEKALEMLDQTGVKACLINDEHRPTTLKQRYRSKGKTLLRVSHLHQGDINHELQSIIIKQIEKIVTEIDLLVFSDFNYGCLPDSLIVEIIRLAKEHQVYIVADSQSSSQVGDVSRYKNIDLLTPTEREARIAMRDHNSGLVVLSESLRKNTDAKNILLKLGEEGVLIHAATKELGHMTDRISALNSSPKDVSGAGDSMLIVSAMSLCLGGSIWESALLGSVAAAVQVSRLGNSPLQLQDLQSVINR